MEYASAPAEAMDVGVYKELHNSGMYGKWSVCDGSGNERGMTGETATRRKMGG